MGLLSDLNWQGAARGLGQGLADTGRAGMLNAFEEKRQKRLASFNAELRATERAEDREYEKGLLSEARQYEEGKAASAREYESAEWERRNQAEHRQAMERDEAKAGRETPDKVETVETVDGQPMIRNRLYQGGKVVEDSSVPVADYLTAKDAKGSKGAGRDTEKWSLQDAQKFYASQAASIYKVPDDSDNADYNENLRAKQANLADTAERLLQWWTSEKGGDIGQASHNNIVSMARRITDGETTFEQVTGQAPKPEAASEMPDMPPAAAHEGRTIRDTETGKRYRSNGSTWEEI